MENTQDVYALALYRVEELVGETPSQDAPESTVVDALPYRLLLELRQRSPDRL
jgi:hypothetical protein